MTTPLIKLQKKIAQKDQLHHWFCEVLEKDLSFEHSIEMVTKSPLHLFSVKGVAFYLQEDAGLQLKKSFRGDKPWHLPSSLDQKLKDFGEKVLANGKGSTLDDFFLLPLQFEEPKTHTLIEILPLGVLVLENANISGDEKDHLQTYGLLTSALLARQRRMEEKHLQIEGTATELTLAQKSQYSLVPLLGGNAPKMAALLELLSKITPSLSSVLIQGESGTGKELIAQMIHYQGPLANQPLVSLHCGALKESLLESQLFGHVKGAFTGAEVDHVGLLVQAHGGTIFLDEIGELSLDVQAKFLRVLQEGEVRPLGSSKVRKVNFRVLAATHRNLEAMVKEGTFREDFYYRLNVIFVQVPPLRERREDIALLVNHFLREEAKGKTKKKISNQALKVLTNAPWPGNVRQLKHTLEFLCTFHSGKRINAKDLPQNLRQVKKEKESLTLDQAKQEFTQNYLKKILAQTGGQIPKAAKLAGLKRESLYRLMRKHLK